MMIHLYRCVFVCIAHNVYERYSCFWFYMYVTLIFFILNIYCYVFITLLSLVLTCVYYYVFITLLYMCVIHHYVFVDLYIKSRGLATIWCQCYLFYNVPTINKNFLLLLLLLNPQNCPIDCDGVQLTNAQYHMVPICAYYDTANSVIYNWNIHLKPSR